MEILTRGVKFNIEFKAANICDVQVINNAVYISASIDKFSVVDKLKIYNTFKNRKSDSINYVTLLIGVDKIGAIDVNKCRVVLEECLTKHKLPFYKSAKCKLNSAEKCSIISIFMPSRR